jgi:hypothetical protein
MINLLPPEEKENSIAGRKRKVLIIFWFYGFFFLCVFSMVLLFLNNYIKNEVEVSKIMLQSAEKGFAGEGIKDIQKQIGEANKILVKVNSFYGKKIYFSDVIDKISKVMPGGVYLNNLSAVYNKGDEKSKGPYLKFSLSGFVAKRDILFELKKNLEADSYFQNVDFPTSNWVKPEDINFFISFNIKK